MKYYIETSVGRIYFESDNLTDVDITIITSKKDGEDKNFKHIKFDDIELFNKFEKMYRYESMFIDNTDNGYFLHVYLMDGYYGSPEYKIFKLENGVDANIS
jgi:hypothetical protein